MCMDTKPKTKKENKVIVLGLGGAGGKIVHYLQEKAADYNLLYADNDEQSITESTVKAIKLCGEEAARGFEQLIKEMTDSKKLIVVGGFGGVFGSHELSVVGVLSIIFHIDTHFILSMPASFEGKKRKYLAESGLVLLKSCNLDYKIIYFDELIKTLDKNVRLCDCFRIMDDVLYQKIKYYIN